MIELLVEQRDAWIENYTPMGHGDNDEEGVIREADAELIAALEGK